VSMPQARSFVGGEWVNGSAVADVNPAWPGEPVAEVHQAGPETARDAVAAAATAFTAWQATPPPSRGAILRRAADLLEQRAESIARDFTNEEGKTLPEAAGEIARAVAIFRYYSGQTLEPDGETFPSHAPSTLLFARREPVGVVLAITPWNFPVAIPAWKIAPAIAYGNSVVWKPAEITPLSAVRVMEALTDAGLPPGVLNLVIGRGSVVGDALVDHPAVTSVTFTGSNAVGRAIQSRATAAGKKVQLELGGKNPAIVLADADLALAAEQVARGAFLSGGQKCTATSRVIVEQGALPEFTERLLERARGWPVGDPTASETRIGPLSSEEQMRTVLRFLDEGRAAGARYLAGGGRAEGLGDGYYVQPTVVVEAAPDSRLVREEIFGPVAALLPAAGFEEALALANDTAYGLSASLFTRDLKHALAFARGIQAGLVKINQESAGVEFQAPFGGFKASSSGSREQGKVAREFFTQWKTIYLDPG
jgi:acyl-CoA reductase-like NAD-dependent aldehyde dehydrogenase